MGTAIHPPLSNIQAELIKLFSAEMPECHLIELKRIIAKFLLDKTRDTADAIWDEKGYTEEIFQQILDKK